MENNDNEMKNKLKKDEESSTKIEEKKRQKKF